MGPPYLSLEIKRPLKFSRENHISPKHSQKDSVCHFKSHTKPLETLESPQCGSDAQGDSQ